MTARSSAIAAAWTCFAISLSHAAEPPPNPPPVTVSMGAQAPWQDLSQQALSLRLTQALSKTLVVGLQPFVERASETGVDHADAMTYGGLLRLADPGPYPGHIAEIHNKPVFVRVSRNLGAKLRLDLYGAAMLGGNIEITDGDGNRVVEDDYRTVPTVALSLAGRF